MVKGCWSGYSVEFEVNGKKYSFKTTSGVRGMVAVYVADILPSERIVVQECSTGNFVSMDPDNNYEDIINEISKPNHSKTKPDLVCGVYRENGLQVKFSTGEVLVFDIMKEHAPSYNTSLMVLKDGDCFRIEDFSKVVYPYASVKNLTDIPRKEYVLAFKKGASSKAITELLFELGKVYYDIEKLWENSIIVKTINDDLSWVYNYNCVLGVMERKN